MQVVTATEIKNQLGDLFDAIEKNEGASVLIERNRRPAAMQQLGLDWYGDLLQRMNTHGIERPSASAEDMNVMKRSVDDVLGCLDAPRTRAARLSKLGR